MSDLMEVISNAVDDAGLNDGSTADTPITESTGSVDTGDAVIPDAPDSADNVAATSETKPATTPIVHIDELTQELEALGVKAPKEGERENRIPYSRMRKIIENALKKKATVYETELNGTKEKLTKAEEKAQRLEAVHALVETDADRYMELLVALHPDKYRKFVMPQQKIEQVQPKPVVQPLPETPPEPDHKFEDGSMGYTQQGHQKLLDWYRSKAKEEAIAEAERRMDEKYGPILKDREVAMQELQLKPKIDAQIARATKIWGKDFSDDFAKGEKSEILAYLRQNRAVPFDAAVAAVLRPRTQPDRDRIRKELMDELNERPAAAAKTVPSAKKAEASNLPRTREDIIRDAMAAAGLN